MATIHFSYGGGAFALPYGLGFSKSISRSRKRGHYQKHLQHSTYSGSSTGAVIATANRFGIS